MNTQNWLWLLALASLGFLASCAAAPPEVVAASATAGAGALVAFVDALKPMLEPEQAARLSSIAVGVQNSTQAMAAAVGAIAEAVQTVKQQAWTGEDVAVATTAGSATALAASRGLSALKHKPTKT